MNGQCSCGSGQSFEKCCGRFIDGGQIPETAEQLMRSRYSAFVAENEDYLLATWHPATRPSRVQFTSNQRWLGLDIRQCEAGQGMLQGAPGGDQRGCQEHRPAGQQQGIEQGAQG